ncbi:MAG: hypothetical protein A2V83_03840 [Nitrospirae bacterium RBG_16_64_22]|nr:MAG: hypothetical protein A2V83_03840 [Nitrospirae bacterium RBG_16_64_22]
MGVFPYQSPLKIYNDFQPVAQYLSRELGRPVLVETSPSMERFVEQASRQRYDIVYAGLSYYIQLREKAGYRAIATVVRGDASSRRGALLARQDSGIRTVSDLKGKKVGALHPDAVCGYVLQRQLLQEGGVNPDRDVEFVFIGKLDSIIFSVLNRTVDAAAVDLSELAGKERGIVDKMRVLAVTPEVPDFPIAVRKGLNGGIVERIRLALIQARDSSVLAPFRATAFEPARDSDYDALAALIRKSP